MKKVVIAFLCGIVISLSSVVIAANELNVTLFPSEFFYNGENKSLPSEYQVINYNGHVYVPIRYVAESMGGTVGFTASQDSKPNEITIDYKTKTKEFPYIDPDKKISIDLTGTNDTSRATYLIGQVQLNETTYEKNIFSFDIDITLKNGNKITTIHGFASDIGKGELKTFKLKSSDFFVLTDIAKVDIKVIEIVEYKSE
ncbi:hypothetical protein GCM10008018_72790 [Paenibacillus marchantiophytorum]|uniref:Copper amine oxidase-like N-terminal domain-containing protein n=1 Tax=Paenibacillus marchantiophytorum TaxID=1619310 RepID=A0ABQ1FL87_9BACL|nr:stalk domain-containing protein [Paenibacillus marchantiophytorum]GGA18286.1 hypothetical protein GCM10008018_72790 [Paenibacillus marchantiophytorum]